MRKVGLEPQADNPSCEPPGARHSVPLAYTAGNYHTVAEISELYAVHRQTVMNDIRTKKLPNARKVFGRWRVPKTDLVGYREEAAAEISKRRARKATAQRERLLSERDELLREGYEEMQAAPPAEGEVVTVRGRSYVVIRADETGFVAALED